MNGTTFNDSLPFAALTVGQAKEMICGLVSQELKKLTPKQERPAPDLMSIDDAVLFLKEQGYLIKKSALYNKTFYNSIPSRKVGKRLVFSRVELLRWLEDHTQHKETRDDAALRLAASASTKR